MVNSSLKLVNSKTLWGQSFNGTGNVSGSNIENAAGDTYWSIRQNGTANFTVLKIGGEQITFTT